MNRGADRYLVWGFVAALALHTAALGAGTRLSAVPVGNGYLEEIQVFDARAPIIVSPVTLVQWHGEPVSARPVTNEGVAITHEPVTSLVATEKPAAAREKPVRQVRRRESDSRGTVSARSNQPGNRRASAPGSRRPAGPPGGGGGGPVDLGSASSNGDLGGISSGGTAAGDVPGSGGGSGSGTGSGTGAGQGGGEGTGTGSGQGGGGGDGAGQGAEGGFISRVADRQEPEVISKGVLTYPWGALEDGVEGTVRLKVLVTEAGEVAGVEVVGSSGDWRLDAAAKEFVGGWRYRPAVQDGKPRRVYSLATVVFELR